MIDNTSPTYKSTFCCPECKQPLCKSIGGGDVPPITLWCGNGPCESIACCNGGEGDTEQQAFTALEKEWAKETK